MSRPQRRGFSLVELLLAAVILALCVIPITGSISHLRTNAMQSRIEAQVQDGIQGLLVQRLDGGKTTALVATGSPVVTTQTLAGGITVTYSLTITAVPGYTKLFAVACTATWAAPSAANRTDTTTSTLYALSI